VIIHDMWLTGFDALRRTRIPFFAHQQGAHAFFEAGDAVDKVGELDWEIQ
jgi:hypothetical protein